LDAFNARVAFATATQLEARRRVAIARAKLLTAQTDALFNPILKPYTYDGSDSGSAGKAAGKAEGKMLGFMGGLEGRGGGSSGSDSETKIEPVDADTAAAAAAKATAAIAEAAAAEVAAATHPDGQPRADQDPCRHGRVYVPLYERPAVLAAAAAVGAFGSAQEHADEADRIKAQWGEVVRLEMVLKEPLGATLSPDGLVVGSLDHGCQAKKAGVGVGWRVIRMAGHPVATLDDLRKLVAKLREEKRTGTTVDHT
jgi:hypothetical protein